MLQLSNNYFEQYKLFLCQTCNARQVLEADHLQKALKTEEEEIENESNAGNNFSEEKGHLNKRLKSFICEEPGCGKSYHARDPLNDHKRSEHGAAKLKCEDSSCTVEFVSNLGLRKHMWARHGVGKGPKCDECEKRYLSPADLENHMRSAHGAPKLPCNVLGCPSTFNCYQALFKHMKTKHSAS